ncbi:MAG TPA: hypothetical protein DEB10_06375 [Ruminococcaceae bacterium]|nr:hypothetical protein [Oscillospiraceae bacterium]HCA30966.1 hypothetical protein [Oscillospiraceae bacterium]
MVVNHLTISNYIRQIIAKFSILHTIEYRMLVPSKKYFHLYIIQRLKNIKSGKNIITGINRMILTRE